MLSKEMVFERDPENRKITVTRNFDAPVELVWRAWTEHEILDLWWAPKPWKTETRFMDFRAGGYWLYAMVGPDGERHWSRMDYLAVDAPQSYTAQDAFCDESGTLDSGMPVMEWKSNFQPHEEGTRVVVTLLFNGPDDLETLVKMGFQEGFAAALSNLDAYFSARVS